MPTSGRASADGASESLVMPGVLCFALQGPSRETGPPGTLELGPKMLCLCIWHSTFVYLGLAFGAKTISFFFFFCTWVNGLSFVLCGRGCECSLISTLAPDVWVGDMGLPASCGCCHKLP